ncbi:hypothetical protein, partial [Thiolapillus sp.]|uniref:hypothetical protein n=1 Tax=Thiolapillus sp. TaxID=2017437 RepID=UPI003AF9C69A
MTRTAGAQIGCQRPSRFWGLGCPKIYHEAEDTLEWQCIAAFGRGGACGRVIDRHYYSGQRSWFLFWGCSNSGR